MNKNDKISDKINLIKLPMNTKFEFELDEETEWVRNILIELNENATEKTPEEYLKETNLVISGVIEKKTKSEMDEFLLVNGQISATYVTECVRTLKPMVVDLDFPIKICFIDEALSTSELFQDVDETFVENEVYELYFYKKRTVDFDDMIHEQVFLNYEQYPILDADSELPGVES